MVNTKTIDPTNISQSKLHSYLLSAVAPRPICFASTINKKGQINLSPFSFFNVFSSNPPIMIFSPARRGRDNTTKHTYENVLEIKEVVINIVNYPIAEQMSLASTEYNRDTNEFIKAGLTQIPSKKILPPRVEEAPVAFECEIDRVIELGDGPGAGNLILAKVLLIHVQEKYLNDSNGIDILKLDLIGRMGGSWYCRTMPESLFEITKPLKTKGIGIDKLPKSIKNSNMLTGNHLGRLGNIAHIPSQSEILELKKDTEFQTLLSQHSDQMKMKEEIYRLAKKMVSTRSKWESFESIDADRQGF